MRTVQKRCDTEDRDAAVASPSRARRGRVALEQRVLGLGVERGGRLVEHEQQRLVAHEAARERELLPLAERHLDAARPGRAELRLEPGRQPRRRRRRRRPARPPCATAGSSSRRGTSPTPTVWRARNSKRKKSWNAPARRVAPRRRPACARGRRRRRGCARTSARRSWRAASRAWSCRRRSRRRSRPPRPRAARASRRRARAASVPGIGERHVLEADALVEARRAPAGRRARRATPRSPRARPAAASRPSRCRAGSRSRRRSRRCRPTAASRRRAPAARRRRARASPDDTNTTAPT